MNRHAIALAIAALAACSPPQQDGINRAGNTFDAIAPEEVVTLIGTEPFWSLRVERGEGVWTTPEQQAGARFPLSRFAGNNGLGFTGTLEGQAFTATVTPGECSDGMSDRRFPFVATIAWGGETRKGCGYSASRPFTGDEAP